MSRIVSGFCPTCGIGELVKAGRLNYNRKDGSRVNSQRYVCTRKRCGKITTQPLKTKRKVYV